MSLRSIRVTVLLSGLIAVAPAVGCGGEEAATSAAAGAAPRTVTIEGADRFPDTGLRDWVSFADHVVLFTVASDREVMSATAEELAAAEYVIGREATLKIEQRLWSAPHAPELPSTITMDVKGWAVKDGRRIAMVADGEPRLEVGQRYVAPLLLMDDRSPAEWWPLTVGSMLELEADTVGPALPHGQGSARQVAGRSIRDVADMVVRQPADPIARRFRNLRPAARVQQVLEALAAERPPE
jgi:hypothetical protein